MYVLFNVGMVDVVFADVAQPDQARIVSINAQHFLKNQGYFVISIKVPSFFVDVFRVCSSLCCIHTFVCRPIALTLLRSRLKCLLMRSRNYKQTS